MIKLGMSVLHSHPVEAMHHVQDSGGRGPLELFFSLSRYFYAPYQIWKKYGIKGPTPVPFFGNYREESKMVLDLWPI